MKKKLFKAIDFTNDEFDWTPPVELPTIVIDAVTEAQELLDPPLSQLKSMLLELPVTLNVPV